MPIGTGPSVSSGSRSECRHTPRAAVRCSELRFCGAKSARKKTQHLFRSSEPVDQDHCQISFPGSAQGLRSLATLRKPVVRGRRRRMQRLLFLCGTPGIVNGHFCLQELSAVVLTFASEVKKRRIARKPGLRTVPAPEVDPGHDQGHGRSSDEPSSSCPLRLDLRFFFTYRRLRGVQSRSRRRRPVAGSRSPETRRIPADRPSLCSIACPESRYDRLSWPG